MMQTPRVSPTRPDEGHTIKNTPHSSGITAIADERYFAPDTKANTTELRHSTDALTHHKKNVKRKSENRPATTSVRREFNIDGQAQSSTSSPKKKHSLQKHH